MTEVYDQLSAEGYLEVQPRSAPVVAAVDEPPPADAEPDPPPPRFDLTPTGPDVSLFPRPAWLRAVTHALRTAPNATLDDGDVRGERELREALSAYLARVRGVRVRPGRIIVTQGSAQALDLLARTLVERGATTVAIETPSSPSKWRTIWASGLRLMASRIDSDGLRTSDLQGGANAVVVTPAHQFPTGAVLTPARRSALVDWAARHDALIIEDDDGAEFRYERVPVAALQGLDPDRVAHVGTVSKTLAPAVRLGWLVVPEHLVDDVIDTKRTTGSDSPSLHQLALARMLTSGEYERHVARMRHVYRRRRDRLLAALHQSMPDLDVRGGAGGTHLLLLLGSDVDDVMVARAATDVGIHVRPLSPYQLDGGAQRALLLGYGRLIEEQVDEAVKQLAALLRVGVPGIALKRFRVPVPARLPDERTRVLA